MEIDIAWVALSLLPHVGSKTIRALLAHFDSVDAVLQAHRDELLQVRGVGQKIAQAITQIDLKTTQKAVRRWQAQDIQIMTRHASHYPTALTQLEDEPAILFLRGTFQADLLQKTAAIVGTRKPSPLAGVLAFHMANKLVERGYTVVSGLALGIDTEAHQGALNRQDGRTVAVMGSGVLNIYPPQHRKLAHDIIQRGLIMSENHPDAAANAARLVARNRIISGLCQHVIVVETGAAGGAMYAAKTALQQGRQLYALDLPASGNQALLQAGAVRMMANLSALPE